MNHLTSIFATAYLPSIFYMQRLLNSENPLWEAHENFVKQSYRTRCDIVAANGKLTLSIPIVRKAAKMPIRDVQISYDSRWQQNHWQSIVSAYNSSPFFEFFTDELSVFYHKPYKFLFDYNFELLQFVFDALDTELTIRYTNSYMQSSEVNDYRNLIHPKRQIPPEFQADLRPYYQTFADKHGFMPNLSVIDLLFNMGSEAVDFLL